MSLSKLLDEPALTAPELRSLILNAAETLLSRCDGAITRDMAGFNGGDSKVVSWILSQRTINDKQIVDLQERLIRYKKTQLPGLGINIRKLFSINYEKIMPQPIKPHKTAEDVKITFGKYKGKTFLDVLENHRGYIEWLAENSYNENIRSNALATLKGTPLTIPKPIKDIIKIIKITLEHEEFRIQSPFIQELLDWLKDKDKTQTRRYDPTTKSWFIHPNDSSKLNDFLSKLKPAQKWITYKVEIDSKVRKYLADMQIRKNLSKQTESNFEVLGLGGELLPFQKLGVQFLNLTKGRGMISDEPGLGKTMQALAYLQLHEIKPALIIVPASLKLNWERESRKWLSYTTNIQIIKTGKIVPLAGDLIIINYDIIKKWQEELINHHFEIMIIDESHYLKGKSQRTTATKELAVNIKQRILLTGTPILNRPIELLPQLQLLDPAKYPDTKQAFWRFVNQYCAPHKKRVSYTKEIWVLNGSSNELELEEELRTLVVRRTKKQVLKELPAKRRSIIPLPLTNKRANKTNMKEYRENTKLLGKIRKEISKIEQKELVLNSALEKANEQKTKNIKTELEKIEIKLEKSLKQEQDVSVKLMGLYETGRQLVIDGKIKAAFEWIENFLATGEKLIVFATHIKTVDFLMAKFPDISVKLTGSCSQQARQESVDQFQNNTEIKLFVGNIKAAGVGLTLTASSTTAFLELGWTPGDHIQAEDRNHRIGQHEAVNIFYLIAEDTTTTKKYWDKEFKKEVEYSVLNFDTIETKILNLIEEKSRIVDQITDKTTNPSLPLFSMFKSLLGA